MRKNKGLSRYQKLILVFIAAISIIFSVVYYVAISRVGIRYNDEILVLEQIDGKDVYSGNINGKRAEFIIYDENTVEFHYDDKNYGRYTLTLDSSVIPEDAPVIDRITGVIIYHGDQVLFSGGVLDVETGYWLYSEDGWVNHLLADQEGDIEPKAAKIYEILVSPKLTHKGDPLAWFFGVLICIGNAFTIVFADELFYYSLSFKIRNAEAAEPTEWEYAERYIGWIVLAVAALILFVTGLK